MHPDVFVCLFVRIKLLDFYLLMHKLAFFRVILNKWPKKFNIVERSYGRIFILN